MLMMLALGGLQAAKSWIFDPSWSQSSQNGVPIVQLMFLYEARARARLVQEHHEHNWDPTFGRFQFN